MARKLKQISIVGVGLIGGSIGLAARQRGVAERVMGIGRDPDKLRAAQASGVLSAATTDLAEGVADADVVVVCTPVRQVARLVCDAAAHVPATALLTDAASTKAGIVADVERRMPTGTHFVGSHPLAGSHESGAAAAQCDLFEHRTVVITPSEKTLAADIELATQFWTALGARVVNMTPHAHDQALAITSHLPHVLAAALATTTPRELLPLVAMGWKDATRMAAGDAELWRDILTANRDNALQALHKFDRVLNLWIEALEQSDDAKIVELLDSGKHQRDAVGN